VKVVKTNCQKYLNTIPEKSIQEERQYKYLGRGTMFIRHNAVRIHYYVWCMYIQISTYLYVHNTYVFMYALFFTGRRKLTGTKPQLDHSLQYNFFFN
jgi:hypothetical protein